MRLYNMSNSGNCYKPRLLAAHLALSLELVPVDVVNGETRHADFIAKNKNGRVPLLELDDGRFLPESNAQLWYLAEGSSFIPADAYERAQVLQWMFFEQYSHEPFIAVARFWWSIKPDGRTEKADDFAVWTQKGYDALDVMEKHLSTRIFFVGERYTVADIALFAYTHNANEANMSLEAYPHIQNWVKRIQSQPNFIPMKMG